MNSGRIAIMLPRFSQYGGVEGIAYRLSEALVAKGHDVHVICARQEAPSPSGVTVIPVGRVGGIKVIKMLWFLVFAERARKKGNYDVTISLGKTWNQDIARTGGGALQVFWELSIEAWPKGFPRIGKMLARIVSPANWLTFLVEKRMFTRTPHIVAISETVKRWIIKAYPHLASDPATSGQKLYTIYNNPDLSKYSPPSEEQKSKARQALSIDLKYFALGLATTNFLLKGVVPLITSLQYLPSEIHLYIAGGRNASKYKQLAKTLGVAERVHFCGKVSDMLSFYQSLDMFILPTFYDTLGNVVLEAMASGVKTLCSNRAGAQDFLPKSQILYDPSDPKEIAEKVISLKSSSFSFPLELKGEGVNELVDLVKDVLTEKKSKEKYSHL